MALLQKGSLRHDFPFAPQAQAMRVGNLEPFGKRPGGYRYSMLPKRLKELKELKETTGSLHTSSIYMQRPSSNGS